MEDEELRVTHYHQRRRADRLGRRTYAPPPLLHPTTASGTESTEAK
jgi:hypothetical protein